jgi:hypothetical protein
MTQSMLLRLVIAVKDLTAVEILVQWVIRKSHDDQSSASTVNAVTSIISYTILLSVN